MAKSLRVRQELETLKPRLDEGLANANAVVKERFPEDKLEEACEKAQDVLDVLRHRNARYAAAYHVFQGVADVSPEDDTIFQKAQPAMQKAVEEAEEIAVRLDKKIKRNLESFAQNLKEEKVQEVEKRRIDLETRNAEAQLQLQTQKQDAENERANAALALTKERGTRTQDERA